MSDIENLSLSTLGPIFMVALMGLGITLLMLLYFLWKQTELVNHVWEAGHFTTPLSNFAYNAQPSGPISYPTPPTTPQPLQPPQTQAPPAPPSSPVEPEQNDQPKSPPDNPFS